MGHRAWGMAHGAWRMVRGAWGVAPGAVKGSSLATDSLAVWPLVLSFAIDSPTTLSLAVGLDTVGSGAVLSRAVAGESGTEG